MAAKRIIITGFDPMFGLKRTPSGDLATLWARGEVSVPGVEVMGIQLPQIYRQSADILIAETESFKPDVVMMFGATMKVEPVRFEKFAINVEHTHMGDNSRIPVIDRTIVPNGPEAYTASWNCGELAHMLKENGSSGKISYHAGTHTCNSIMYLFMHHLAMTGKTQSVKAGFIHVPFPGDYGIHENTSAISTLNDITKASMLLVKHFSTGAENAVQLR